MDATFVADPPLGPHPSSCEKDDHQVEVVEVVGFEELLVFLVVVVIVGRLR